MISQIHNSCYYNSFTKEMEQIKQSLSCVFWSCSLLKYRMHKEDNSSIKHNKAKLITLVGWESIMTCHTFSFTVPGKLNQTMIINSQKIIFKTQISIHGLILKVWLIHTMVKWCTYMYHCIIVSLNRYNLLTDGKTILLKLQVFGNRSQANNHTNHFVYNSVNKYCNIASCIDQTAMFGI